jgi:hypothetical protein
MKEKEYSRIISQVTREIKREQRKNAFKYISDPSQDYIRWTVEQFLPYFLQPCGYALVVRVHFRTGTKERGFTRGSVPFLFPLFGGRSLHICLCYTRNTGAGAAATGNQAKDQWSLMANKTLMSSLDSLMD